MSEGLGREGRGIREYPLSADTLLGASPTWAHVTQREHQPVKSSWGWGESPLTPPLMDSADV